jgi:hypothetical protein
VLAMIQTEERDFPVRKIQWVAASLVILLILIGIGLLTFQNHLVAGFRQIEIWPSTTPRSQKEFESGEIRNQLQIEQLRNLQSYQNLETHEPWVQVPIERAMSFLLEKKSTDPRVLFFQNQGVSK